jgi:signal transduction histidine kinase
MDNAFFFSSMAVNKTVTLTIIKNTDVVIIKLTDHGPGIKADVKEKIFSMFFRGNELSTGNGLGLYLVKSALSKIDGTIEVETEEARYSTFIITLQELP